MTDMGKRSGRVWTTISAWVLLAVVVVGAPGPVEAAEDAAADRGSQPAKLAPVVFPIDLGSIPAGATVTLEFDVQVDNPLTSFPAIAVSNQGTVSGDGFADVLTDDPAVGGASDPTVTLLDTADLVLTKIDTPDPVVAGEALQYTISVLNNGPSVAENVVVTDNLPPGMTFVGTTGCAEDPAGMPTCTLGNIAVGVPTMYTINVTVDPTASGQLINNASVTSTTAEAAPGNESASSTTTVIVEADLAITKADTIDPVTAGTDLGYTLVVSNAGPSDDPATVTVTDTLPAGVALCQRDRVRLELRRSRRCRDLHPSRSRGRRRAGYRSRGRGRSGNPGSAEQHRHGRFADHGSECGQQPGDRGHNRDRRDRSRADQDRNGEPSATGRPAGLHDHGGQSRSVRGHRRDRDR